jgi:ribosomal protein S18 acetylase RimI-like enzyme
MIIDKPEAAHLPAIAACHRKAFPRALSSAMGQAYVEKMLEWYLVDKRAFLFFSEENGTCTGYCGGLVADGKVVVGSASSMIQHSFRAAVNAILFRPWLLFHIEFGRKYRLIIKNIWRRLRKQMDMPGVKSSPSGKVVPRTGLIVIGVDPAYRGRGIATELLKEFERQSRLRGYQNMMLTVRSDNFAAIRAYERSGWYKTVEHHGSITMEKKSTS